MSSLTEQLSRSPHEKKWMFSRIEMVKYSPDGAKRWLKDLGKNDFEHAQAVEEYASKIITESNVRLLPEEIYLLLHAIYTHDIGYRVSPANHAKESHDLIVKFPERYFIYDDDLSKSIALINLSHGINDLADIPSRFPINFLSRTEQFDLRFLGALLLIADEMDQAYLRVFNRIGQEFSMRNEVFHVEIGPQIVKIKTKPSSEEQWKELNRITEYVQKRLNNIIEILHNRNIKLEQITLYPKLWSQEGHTNKAKKAFPLLSTPKKQFGSLLFVTDGSVLSSEVLQKIQSKFVSTTVISVHEAHEEHPSKVILRDEEYALVVLMLSEGFAYPLKNDFLNKVLLNTKRGGGLVVFPFVAWSVSQGINDELEGAMPVYLSGDFWEGKKQQINKFYSHEITNGVKDFEIENTFESLDLKNNANCIIQDSEGFPVLVLGTYGEGHVAYLNFSSHLCLDSREMVSPWQQSSEIQKIILNTIEWLF